MALLYQLDTHLAGQSVLPSHLAKKQLSDVQRKYSVVYLPFFHFQLKLGRPKSCFFILDLHALESVLAVHAQTHTFR